MKLSSLYSNQPEIFRRICFSSGLNVVLAEIRLPENKKRDTHNLGKTTLGRLIDFCFLAKRDKRSFLFKHFNRFKTFVFFLEVALEDGTYVTVRRSVENASKASFCTHQVGQQDFNALPASAWDHWDVPFEKSRELLDGILDWRAFKPWSYRLGLGYLLRSQDDFRDVFHLRKFAASHAEWKPFLAHVLGFQDELVAAHYEGEKLLTEKTSAATLLKQELGGTDQAFGKIEGLLLLKNNEIERKQAVLDRFDFRAQDAARTSALVDEVNESISALNLRRYTLVQNRRKIADSLAEGRVLFDPDAAQALFFEAGVVFQGQIKRDFEELVAFNRAITEERSRYLEEEKAEVDTELKSIDEELARLSSQRAQALAQLSQTDPFLKYKDLSNELSTLRGDVLMLERQRDSLRRLHELRSEIRTIEDRQLQLQTAIESDVEFKGSDAGSLFSRIRIYFNEIVEEVLDRKALLSVIVNTKGHLEFRAEILDSLGNATSADLGHTYRKLLCVAFDLAVLRAHAHESFPRFVYHDGMFESLDDRKKQNLLSVVRRYSELGLQPVITLIDSDLPSGVPASSAFEPEEVVLTLHDEGADGRLFKMGSW